MTRIRINNVVFIHKDVANDEKIRQVYPDVSPAQIHAAPAYSYDNREEIDAALAADESWAESLDLGTGRSPRRAGLKDAVR